MRANTIKAGAGPCDFCGEQHEPIEADAESDVYLYVCPQLPQGVLYVAHDFPSGPPGLLYLLGPPGGVESSALGDHY